ncbi:MAG: DUF938 domain-containing protein [Woeseiaceae bacterium]|nr:DUF938 domain-containing protein [Woeseiaceae bacterium]
MSRTDLPSAPATARNRDPILTALADELVAARSVLEIGSGTGEHAVYFAPRLDWLEWQPSDRRGNLAGIRAWVEARPAPNLRPPIELDVNSPPEFEIGFDAVFSANTAHIMGPPEVERMFALIGRVLKAGGRFCLYGPFNRDGRFTSESNARFDASLRAQDPRMGIRDLSDLDSIAEQHDLRRVRLHTMPANNFLAVWQMVDH